jgi:hypothetical protein
MMSKELKEFTREEVATKTSESASWIIIDGLIYNISTFAAMHPGGEKLLRHYAGKDATGLSLFMTKADLYSNKNTWPFCLLLEEFYGLHRHEVLKKYSRLLVGKVKGETPKAIIQDGGKLSVVPYGESSYFIGFRSPYYK